jgi:hypothetical protein
VNDKPTDGPTDEPGGDEGPITPEVVRGRGAAARKRRPAGEPPEPEHVPGAADASPSGGRYAIFHLGCMAITLLGVLELAIATPLVLDPEQARCTAARFRIDQAIDDDEDFNDVALPEGAEEADDVECADAIELAGQVPDDEDEEPEGTFPEESAFRTQGLIVSALGLAHGVVGFLTLRTRSRAWRTGALGLAALGLLFPVLAIISMVLVAFVVYALAFSRDSKELFGVGGGFLRPRMPRPPT